MIPIIFISIYLIKYFQMRAELIPAIVILLQKQWRGAICRAKFRKMKAAYFIGMFYRRYKIRTYIKSVLEALK